MEPIRSGASLMLTDLLTWRNNYSDLSEFVCKGIATEFSLLLLLVVAVVETIAYAILLVVCLLGDPCNKAIVNLFVSLLESSAFAILWAGVDLYYAFAFEIEEGETNARFWFQNTIAPFFVVVRSADYSYINAPPMPIEATSREQLVENAVDIFNRYIQPKLTQQSITSIEELDDSSFIFVFINFAYLYAVGALKNQSIPHFFLTKNIAKIKEIREKNYFQLDVWTLGKKLGDSATYQEARNNNSLKLLLNDLSEIGYEETQGISNCLILAMRKIYDERSGS